jgi:sarcosine oxidase subunit gamma
VRRSPLTHAADRLATVERDSDGAVSLVEEPFLTQVNLRLDPDGGAAGKVGLELGAPLPVRPGTTVRAGDLTILWLGPDEWLVVAPPGAATDLQARLRTAAGEEPVSVVDVSAQRTTLLVSGPRARDLLAMGCALDLHPRSFGTGACAQTMLARAQVVIMVRDADRPVFSVGVRASFAAYLVDWLIDAATEFTGGRSTDVPPPESDQPGSGERHRESEHPGQRSRRDVATGDLRAVGEG